MADRPEWRMIMKINYKLITLGVALGLLGTAFAKPSPYFEKGGLSHEQKTVSRHVPTPETSGTTRRVRVPSADPVLDQWPSDMLLG
jgi:hypothetical protein